MFSRKFSRKNVGFLGITEAHQNQGSDPIIELNKTESLTFKFQITLKMKTLKRMINTLGVTMEELRGGGRERRLADARALIAAALPITQEQVAELLGCSQPAVSAMRKRHHQLLVSDCHYRAKWQSLNNESTQQQFNKPQQLNHQQQ